MDKHLINASTSALNIYRLSYSRSLNVPGTVSNNFYWLYGCNCTQQLICTYQFEIRCLRLCEVTLNPMMSSLSRRCRLPDCKVISPAPCSLPLNGDGRRLWLTKITITVKFCSLSFLVSGIFTCGGGEADLQETAAVANYSGNKDTKDRLR